MPRRIAKRIKIVTIKSVCALTVVSIFLFGSLDAIFEASQFSVPRPVIYNEAITQGSELSAEEAQRRYLATRGKYQYKYTSLYQKRRIRDMVETDEIWRGKYDEDAK